MEKMCLWWNTLHGWYSQFVPREFHCDKLTEASVDKCSHCEQIGKIKENQGMKPVQQNCQIRLKRLAQIISTITSHNSVHPSCITLTWWKQKMPLFLSCYSGQRNGSQLLWRNEQCSNFSQKQTLKRPLCWILRFSQIMASNGAFSAAPLFHKFILVQKGKLDTKSGLQQTSSPPEHFLLVMSRNCKHNIPENKKRNR